MTKAFFEKLTHAGQDISTKESVIKNVEGILNGGGLLDADAFISNSGSVFSVFDGMYRNRLHTVVDQSLDNQHQMGEFQRAISQMLKKFEPRIKSILVLDIGAVNQRSRCQLKIELEDEHFEQDFIFS